MNILTLDIASVTGWAIQQDGIVRSGIFDMSMIEDYGERGSRFSSWLTDMITEHDIKKMVCEATMSHGFSSYVLIGLGFLAQVVAHRNNLSRSTVSPTKLKKFTTGHGRASKADMMEAVRKMGFHPKDDNEADALALLTYALKELL